MISLVDKVSDRSSGVHKISADLKHSPTFTSLAIRDKADVMSLTDRMLGT